MNRWPVRLSGYPLIAVPRSLNSRRCAANYIMQDAVAPRSSQMRTNSRKQSEFIVWPSVGECRAPPALNFIDEGLTSSSALHSCDMRSRRLLYAPKHSRHTAPRENGLTEGIGEALQEIE